MFNLFNKKTLIADFSRKWLLENYEWLIRNSGRRMFMDDVVLVLPSDEFFPEQIQDPKQLINYAFEQIKKYALMDDWPIYLIEKERNPDPVVGSGMIIHDAPFDVPIDTILPETDDDPILIACSSELADDLNQLSAALAYEFARIYASYIDDPPPCEEEALGHNVELTAIFLGFGIILANNAFKFEQYVDADSQGWSAGSSGYLSQYETVYALAIFCELKSIDNSVVERHLNDDLISFFKLARQELKDDEKILWRLKNIK